MKVNLNIEEDEQFRTHVKSLIEGQVRFILREQLSGIVAGEIAKLRFMDPNSKTLSDLVTKEVNRIANISITKTQILEEVQRQVAANIKPYVADIAKDIKSTMAAAVTKALNT